MDWMSIILLAIGVIVVLLVVYYFNRIIVLRNRVRNAWAQIDVQLKKRADLVPNLVETVKGYAKHEREVFQKVTEARSALLKATNVKEAREANNMLTDALKSLFAVAEAYPELKASENFRVLQEQLEGIENKIAYARQFYNDSVLEYNNAISTFPGIIFAKLLGAKPEEYFEIEEVEREVPKVKF